MLTYYTRKESRVQIADSGEHTRLACRFRRLAETNLNRLCCLARFTNHRISSCRRLLILELTSLYRTTTAEKQPFWIVVWSVQ